MLERAGMKTFDEFLVTASRGERVSASRSGETHRVRLNGDGGPVIGYLKRYDYSRRRRWRWQREKATVESRNYKLMHERSGVGVPDVMARGVRSHGLRHLEGFILTRAIAGATALDAFAESGGRVPLALQDGLAAAVRRMHAADFFHIDLQWQNILVTEAGGDYSVHFLDSTRGGLRRTTLTRAHGRIRDLSSLQKGARHWLSPRRQLRWLRSYLGRPFAPLDRAMIRTILRDRAIKDHTPTA